MLKAMHGSVAAFTMVNKANKNSQKEEGVKKRRLGKKRFGSVRP